MKLIKVRFGQTIEDIAIQEYGSLSGVRFLLEDNPSISLDTLLFPGQELSIRIVELTDSEVQMVNYLKQNKLNPVGGFVGEKPEISYVDEDYVEEGYL